MFISIKIKILIFQIGLNLLLALIIGFSSYFFMVASLMEGQKKHLEYIAQSQASQLSSSIQSRANALAEIAQGKPIEAYSEKYRELILIEYFGRFRQQFPILAFVNEMGREEVKLMYGEESMEFSDVSQTPGFQEAIRNPNKVFISPVVQVLPLHNGSRAAFLEFAFYFQSFFDKFVGLTIGKAQLADIARDIQEFRFGQSGFLLLMDNRGVILSCPRKDRILRELPVRGRQTAEIIATAKAMHSSFGRAFLLDTDGYIACAPVRGINSAVIAILPYREFMAAPNTLRKTIAGISLVILVVSIFLSLGISNTISNPLLKLAATTKAIAQGDLSQKVDIRAKDEIGILSEAFNSMTGDLKKSRNELLTAKEYTDSILKSITDTLLVIGQDMKIRMVNKATCELTGYKEEDLIGQPFTVLLAGEFLGKSVNFERLIGKGTFVNYETRYRTRGGNPIPMIFSGTIIRDKSGDAEGIVIIAKDITERKAAEEKLAHYAAQLKERNEELMGLVYTLHHHLKEPMVNIKGFSGELGYHLKRADFVLDNYFSRLGKKDQERLTSIIDKDMPESIKFIDSSVNKMNSMINAISNLLNLESRKLNAEPINMGTLTRSVLEDIRDRLEEYGVKVTIGALPEVIADKAAMKHVISIILDNAVKYLEPERSGKIDMSAERDTQGTTFHIRDNGRGIAGEDIPKVFGFFRRAGKQNVPGEGMGLACARVLLRRHGGRIWCESEAGVGTTFSFTIPNRLEIKNQQESTEGALTGLFI